MKGQRKGEVERQFRVTRPQQIEADLIKTSMLNLSKVLEDRGMKARLVIMVHDSIWIEAPLAEEAEVSELMRTSMTEQGSWTCRWNWMSTDSPDGFGLEPFSCQEVIVSSATLIEGERAFSALA